MAVMLFHTSMPKLTSVDDLTDRPWPVPFDSYRRQDCPMRH